MTVQQVYDLIDSLAPFASQASFDNAGLLVGDPAQQVTGILLTMDVTASVLQEAQQLGANLIVAHHPLMFGGTHAIRMDDLEGRLISGMIRSSISLIAAHTNLDQAAGGINDVLAQTCGLTDITGEGYWRIGRLPAGMTPESLPGCIARQLDTTVRVMGQTDPAKPLHTMVVASGAGSDSWEEAARLGADVFLSGEIKHHHALQLADRGILALECGHHATEEPGIFALAKALQSYGNAVQWKGCVSTSRVGAYAHPVRSEGGTP